MLKQYFNIVRLSIRASQYFSANIREQRIPAIRDLVEIKPFTLNNLWDNDGARHKTKRLGRGSASGKGNSCGRGQRGQRSRASIGIRPQFEGGQAALQKRLPKWGLKAEITDVLNEVNLSQVLNAIDRGLIDPQQIITIRAMKEAGIFKRVRYGVKLLARGSERLTVPLQFEVSDASAFAVDAIKQAGGAIQCVYRTPLLMKEHLRPDKFDLQLRDPIPPAYKIKHLERIKARGAEVIYNKPRWQENQEREEEKEKETKDVVPIAVQAELSAKELKKKQKKGVTTQSDALLMEEQLKNLKIPVSREEGCGRSKIRRRKQRIFRKINYKM